MRSNTTTPTDNALIYEVHDNGVALIKLNRPKLGNAFDDNLIKHLTNAFIDADNNDSVSVILLCSNGKHFSAGADLNWMKSMANANYDENLSDAHRLAKLMSTINACSKPVVARVQGAAYGGAIGLIACSDIAIAENGASFALSEVKLGLSPATISPYVIDAIGARAARRLFLTGEVFDANKALSIGLISEVTPPDLLIETTDSIISSLLKNGPTAIASTKALIDKVSRHENNEQLTDYTCELIAALRVSEEGQEGLSAFLEKRAPNWPPRTKPLNPNNIDSNSIEAG
ncbi:enoyl-CoA hydratase/isomerase family protein [Alkalimarinus coralli]|uniref:enoyl-CoA hydratase/isomerase family protein n=1 Tax=Alkalimarinus coralli TaxID=2935863 RepID=UPI00202B1CD5|nr:enoyl-CoA hydratase/isomerase family protein [Alkalimarinus coralli]